MWSILARRWRQFDKRCNLRDLSGEFDAFQFCDGQSDYERSEESAGEIAEFARQVPFDQIFERNNR